MILSTKIRELAAKASKGPFKFCLCKGECVSQVYIDRDNDFLIEVGEPADGEITALLLNNLPKIIAALELAERVGTLDPVTVATEVAERCHRPRKPGEAPQRYAMIYQAAYLGAQAAITALKGPTDAG